MEGALQQIVHDNLLHAVREVEDQLDAQLKRFDNLDEDGYEELRRERLRSLKQAAARRKEWLQKGHGEYRDIGSEKDFFAEMKGEERMVCHFYRDNWPCKVMDKHMEALAGRHMETKFVRIHAEKSPFLTERLKIWMLPTLALIKREKTVDYVVGFDDMGGKDDFPTSALEARLVQAGVMDEDGDAVKHQRHAEPVRNVRTGGVRPLQSDEDSDFD